MPSASATFIILLLVLSVGAIESSQDLRCRLCNKLKTLASGIPQSRLRFVPALKEFSSKSEEFCLKPCLKYSPNITCSLCEYLLEVGEDWKDQPEDVFIERERYACTTLGLMYPLCNVVLDEFEHKLYEFEIQNLDHFEACLGIELCLPE